MKLLKGKKAGNNVQIKMAVRILERTLRTFSSIQPSQSLDVNCLKDIAGIKAALEVLAGYLGDDFGDNLKKIESFPKCIEAARLLCSNLERSPIRLFLLKQLLHKDCNGIDAIKKRCERTELQWILQQSLEVVCFS